MGETDEHPSKARSSIFTVTEHEAFHPSSTTEPSPRRSPKPGAGHLLALLELQKRYLRQKVKECTRRVVEGQATDSPGKMLQAMLTRDVALAMLQKGGARRRELRAQLDQDTKSVKCAQQVPIINFVSHRGRAVGK